MIKRVCGIDPGLSSGAIAFYGRLLPLQLSCRLWTAVPIPTVGDGSSKRINATLLSELLGHLRPEIAYIEDGQTMPGQASGSMGRYLRACGAIEATVELAGIQVVPVRPHVWKPAMGLRKATKRQSIDLARELFPTHADTTFKLQKSHNLAEAALLALYGASRCDMVRLEAA